jgi:hypothetical protein
MRLRLGPQHCAATLWQGHFRPSVVATAEVHSVTKPIAAVLEALAAQGHDKPSSARVCIEDELLYYDLWPAVASGRAGEEARQLELREVHGDEPMAVSSRLTPCGTQWLSVAMSQALLSGLQDELAEHGVRLRQVSAAMPDDLFAVRDALPHSGVVALLREEGMVLLSLVRGRLTDVSWERCNLGMAASMIDRIKGYVYRFARAAPDDAVTEAHPDVLLVVTHAAQRVKLSRLAKAREWRVVSLEDQAVPVVQVAA